MEYRRQDLQEEEKNPDFWERRDFINVTGIFVTPDYFEQIKAEFEASGKDVDHFARSYRKTHASEVKTVGKITFLINDTLISCITRNMAEPPTVYEILESFCVEREKYKKQIAQMKHELALYKAAEK